MHRNFGVNNSATKSCPQSIFQLWRFHAVNHKLWLVQPLPPFRLCPDMLGEGILGLIVSQVHTKRQTDDHVLECHTIPATKR